jgi:RNA polymerase sigma-70 factor (ECF subfamily)
MQLLSRVSARPYAGVMYEHSTPQEDGELARRIVAAGTARDAAAEAELCRRFAPRIRLYGLRHLRSDAAAADLVQEVLMLTLEKLRAGAVREPDKLASFILGTCRQTVVDGRRSGFRRERILDTFAPTLPDVTEDAVEGVDTARLERCLEQLPERERSVLVMTFYDDRAADEVGAALGLSPGNVRVIRHRGIERLRLCVEAQP